MVKIFDGKNGNDGWEQNERQDQDNHRKQYVKGSFTVEASFIVPILLFLIVGSIHLGYRLFQEAKAACEISEEIKELDPVSIVRNATFVRDKIPHTG